MHEYDNPFYRNFIFTEADMQREKLSLGNRFRLLLNTMYHQSTADGYEVSYKMTSDGRIFIFKMEKSPDVR